MVPSDEQHTLSYPTDTATPVTPIPIFYLHAGEHPFCRNPACLCHVNEARFRELLHGVLDRSLRLREVCSCAVRHLADSEGGSQ
jgi:hypothetical protein